MLEAMAQGLAALFTPTTLLFMTLGVVVSQIIVVLPGLGGHFALVVLLPFVYTMDPAAAIAMLTGAAVTSGTGNTVTSVLFGVPGSPTGVATLLDGYPMSQKGLGARAVSAGLGASVLGGIFGAIALALLIPVARPLVLALSSPEYFLLIICAVILVANIGEGDPVKSLVAGALGFIASFVGRETSTGAARFTFDRLELWDGFELVAVFVGIFAIAEMVDLIRRGGTIARAGSLSEYDHRDIVRGLADTVRHWRATVQSSTAGAIVGLVPGLGGAASQFIAYSYVSRRSKNQEKFGTGEVEGVIAADASVNSTDASQMVPTLAFGIPGSSLAAIMLAGYVAVGVRPGREMLETGLDIVWLIIWVLVLANIISALLCIGIGSIMARLTFLPSSYIVVPILGLSFLGTYAANARLFDVGLALVFGAVGFAFKRFNYSRSAFVIGYVLGDLLEHHLLLTTRLFGFEMFLRPTVILLLVGVALSLLIPFLRRLRAPRPKRRAR